MMNHFMRLLRANERGAAVIELAIVSPVLALLVVGVTDLSNAYGRKLKAEQAAQRAIEKIMNTSADDTVEATLQKEAADQAEVPLANVTVTYRLECNGVKTTADDCGPGEKVSQWIEVRVKDEYDPMFPTTFEGIDGGVYEVEGRAGVRIG